jgi:hypothetical protein
MRNKIFKIIYFLAAALILSSCLKDNQGEDWTSSLKGKMYAEIWKPGYLALGLAPVPDTVTFKFLVNIATDQPPTQDITVSLGVNQDAMDRYNALKGTAYKLFPNIMILDPTVTIKAGTRNAYAHVSIWGADQLNACDNFMAPISITNATGGVVVSEALNNGSRLMALPISNPYAADYHCFGYRIRPGNPTEPVDQTENLSTVDCKTVTKVGFGNYSAYNINIEVTATTIVVGGTTCFKVIATPFDPATGSSVGGMFTSWTGDPATPPAPPADPTWINYYNPVTRQFVLNCFYISSAGNRIMYEVLTRE